MDTDDLADLDDDEARLVAGGLFRRVVGAAYARSAGCVLTLGCLAGVVGLFVFAVWLALHAIGDR